MQVKEADTPQALIEKLRKMVAKKAPQVSGTAAAKPAKVLTKVVKFAAEEDNKQEGSKK